VLQATEGTTIDTNLLYYGDNLDALRRDLPGRVRAEDRRLAPEGGLM
jgi:hypothetical protein